MQPAADSGVAPWHRLGRNARRSGTVASWPRMEELAAPPTLLHVPAGPPAVSSKSFGLPSPHPGLLPGQAPPQKAPPPLGLQSGALGVFPGKAAPPLKAPPLLPPSGAQGALASPLLSFQPVESTTDLTAALGAALGLALGNGSGVLGAGPLLPVPQARSQPLNCQDARVAHYRERLVMIYRVHKPDNVSKVDYLLQKYQGQEDFLYNSVCSKYGVPNDGLLASAVSLPALEHPVSLGHEPPALAATQPPAPSPSTGTSEAALAKLSLGQECVLVPDDPVPWEDDNGEEVEEAEEYDPFGEAAPPKPTGIGIVDVMKELPKHILPEAIAEIDFLLVGERTGFFDSDLDKDNHDNAELADSLEVEDIAFGGPNDQLVSPSLGYVRNGRDAYSIDNFETVEATVTAGSTTAEEQTRGIEHLSPLPEAADGIEAVDAETIAGSDTEEDVAEGPADVADRIDGCSKDQGGSSSSSESEESSASRNSATSAPGSSFSENAGSLAAAAAPALHSVADGQGSQQRGAPDRPLQRDDNSSALPDAVASGPHTMSRAQLIRAIFRSLDKSYRGGIGLEAMQRFATLNGFEGSDDEWAEEYASLCVEWQVAPQDGFVEEVFARLLDDRSERGCYCSDDELQGIFNNVTGITIGDGPMLQIPVAISRQVDAAGKEPSMLDAATGPAAEEAKPPERTLKKQRLDQ